MVDTPPSLQGFSVAPTAAASNPRVLLKRLHSVMASGGTGEERLSRIVRVVAQNMVAEVCSIYLMRAGGVLELFATEGLKEEAVHQTRLTKGQGLVGLVAERGLPVNLHEAPAHPRFVYRPETGEEIYHSFLGVPILRMGKVSGVLTIQNVAPRRYLDEEVEVLQTIAMVLAELVSGSDLISGSEMGEDRTEAGQPVTLDGLGLTEGVGYGTIVFHRPQVAITRTIADDIQAELTKLDTAIEALAANLQDMLDHPDLAHGGEHREVLETYRMFVFDRGWQERMRGVVRTGLTAEAAASRIQTETRRKMEAIGDPYLRERASDFDDLASRLIRQMQGQENAHPTLNDDSILVARTLGPAELMDYDRTRLKAVALEDGSTHSHMAIVARAMGIPVLGRVQGLLQHAEMGEAAIVDSRAGHIYLRPSEDVVEAYKATLVESERRAALYEAERDLPGLTEDGVRMTINMNAGLLVDLPNIERTGAEGIGLFRTEFQFMVAPTLPKVEEQAKIYSAALDAAGDKPVVFRTLDVGGDKHVPFLPREAEENPAMGWRAIRIALDRPALLRYQLRALLYAAAGRKLNVMFPMIAEVDEFRRCRKIFNKELSRLKLTGREAPSEIKLGCMLEVPSLAWQLDQLLPEVDFLSIGTNDLMQFFFACDRGSPRLEGRYDLLSPAVLRFLADVFSRSDKAGVPVTLCGEMGGHPLEALALLAIGCRSVSVGPLSVGPVKRMIRSVRFDKLEPYVRQKIAGAEHSIRDSLKNFASDHGIKL